MRAGDMSLDLLYLRKSAGMCDVSCFNCNYIRQSASLDPKIFAKSSTGLGIDAGQLAEIQSEGLNIQHKLIQILSQTMQKSSNQMAITFVKMGGTFIVVIIRFR